jgi:N-sulfoglucosamine sulfohydrolase
MIIKHITLTLTACFLFTSCSKRIAKVSNANTLGSDETLNILFLTSDDLNFDSVGAYGSVVENATPNIDKLAEEGMLFERAYVQAPSCTPSRNVFITGNYPHNSGVEGFFSVDFPQATLPEALRNNGYFTGVIQKVIDMTPTNNKAKVLGLCW